MYCHRQLTVNAACIGNNVMHEDMYSPLFDLHDFVQWSEYINVSDLVYTRSRDIIATEQYIYITVHQKFLLHLVARYICIYKIG